MKKLKLKLAFHYRNASFSIEARSKLAASTFLPLMDDGDLLNMTASVPVFTYLDTVYHGALGLVTGCTMLTHHCSLYTKANSLSRRRHTHWLTFIFKSHCTSLLSVHFHFRLHWRPSNLCSSDLHLTSVPKDQTELGRMAFSCFAPSCWISQQTRLKLEKLITVDEFKKKKKS